VENLRFWPEEEANSEDFARKLASLGEAYVNEAFANCHREHASIVGIPKFLPSFAGVSLSREIEVLTKLKNNPDKPFVVVIGGAKLETKEPLVNVFAESADQILVGGKVAVDMKDKGNMPGNVVLAELTPNGRDITESSARKFADIIMNAKTVIWNGTMGVFEESENQQGTKIVAEAINNTPAFTVIGGGDTETALTEFNLESGIDYISTGGGAMLELLSKGTLPGFKVLV
jgi:phosphoglycerate kinase